MNGGSRTAGLCLSRDAVGVRLAELPFWGRRPAGVRAESAVLGHQRRVLEHPGDCVKISALPSHRNVPLRVGSAVSQAPSALWWLHCLQRQFVQRERPLLLTLGRPHHRLLGQLLLCFFRALFSVLISIEVSRACMEKICGKMRVRKALITSGER